MHWKKVRSKLARFFRKRRSKTIQTVPAEPEPKPSEPPISTLPMELLLEVYSYLNLPNQICLAMSSKGLCQVLGSVLQTEELRFPRLCLSKKGKHITKLKKYHIRMEFLNQLEDSRWACCTGCQKLHPWEEFDQFRGAVPGRKSYVSWARLVDLCSCITLTLRDRQKLVEYLTGTASEQRITHINKGCWKGSQDTQGERYLIHNCKAYPNIRTDVQLSLNFEDHLTACTRYEFRTMDTPKMKSVFACPELNLWGFMNPVLKSYDYETGVNCGHCHARLTGLAD